MVDNLTPEQRSYCMSRVRSTRNQATEQQLASLLRKTDLTGWRRHQPIMGRPDFVWRKEKLAVFVDGCFWHGHDCGKDVSPKTNSKVWRKKIGGNRVRDRKTTRILRQDGWKIVRIWECRLAKKPNLCVARVRRALSD